MRKNKSAINKKAILICSAAGLVIILAILELTNATHLLHKQKIPPVIPAHTNTGAPINNTESSQPSSSSNSASSPTGNSQLPADTSQHTLVAPFGNFVSNHFPGQDGSPEASVCNTSAGATCYIKFTNIDTKQTTQLASQTADTHGSTSWYWDISQDAHLTSGQWQVTAIASLGGQTKSTNDSLKLTIQ